MYSGNGTVVWKNILKFLFVYFNLILQSRFILLTKLLFVWVFCLRTKLVWELIYDNMLQSDPAVVTTEPKDSAS